MDFLQSVARRVVFKAYLSSDHITPATGKTIAIQLSKNGGSFADPAAGPTNATEIASGWYYVDLDTSDTDTLGPLIVQGAEGTIDDVGVLAEVVTGTTVSVIKDDVITATAIAADAITVDKIANDAITAAKIATDAIDADALASDAVTEIQDGLATAAELATVAGYLDTEIAEILADTNELQTDWADGGRLDLLVDAIKVVTDDLTSAINVADTLLNRDLSEADGGAASGRLVLDALRRLRNKWDMSGGTLNVRKEDDSTVAWSATVQRHSGFLKPVRGLDPS